MVILMMNDGYYMNGIYIYMMLLHVIVYIMMFIIDDKQWILHDTT